MNNIIKMRLLASLVFTTVIAIGLFSGISTISNINDGFVEKDQQIKSSNNDGRTITISLEKDNTEKCDPIIDPRC
jgi:hypothetical protein